MSKARSYNNGKIDYERQGRYGYDSYEMDRNRDYTDGFNDARRAEDRRQERREEDMREQQMIDQRRQSAKYHNEQQDNEEDYLSSMYAEQERRLYMYHRRIKGHLRRRRIGKLEVKKFWVIVGGTQKTFFSKKTKALAYKACWIDDLPF